MSDEGSAEDRVRWMSKKFGWLMNEVGKEIRESDPRSFDLCLARMEEGLMWANKGIMTQQKRKEENDVGT